MSITEKEIEMLKQIEAQANPNPWTDFAGNGRSHRTHIGYQANTIDEGGNPVNVALFETNTNAKRADVLLAVYSRNYFAPLLNELTQLRAENAALKTFVTKLASHPCENFTAGWDCNVDGRTATAEDCADRMCIPCQAREVLDNK